VKDTIVGHESKELLEGYWVTSDYGVPPITISTPKVLKRDNPPIPEEVKAQMEMTNFSYGSVLNFFSVSLTTAKLKQQEAQEEIDLNQDAENAIKQMELLGVQNILVKHDKFVTPNNAEGLKTYGSASFPSLNSESTYEGEYILLHFTAENVVQQITLTWRKDDVYATNIVERIINSVELVKEESPDKKQEEN